MDAHMWITAQMDPHVGTTDHDITRIYIMNPLDIVITLFKVFTARRTASVSIGSVKQWYQSKAIVGGVVGVIVGLSMLFGVDLKGQESELTVIVMSLIGLAANVWAMYGRVKGESKINDTR